MPASNLFQVDSKNTLKNIMKPKQKPISSTSGNKEEREIMKYLLKESKKEALATHLPKKSSKSRGRPPAPKIPTP